MAEGGGSNENPFSFKKFVKSKHETKIPTTKKTQGKQTSKTSAVNQRNKDIFEDEAPFPEVNKEVDSDGGKEDLNPFSYKRFVSDDLASRNKRVLQIIDDEVHEVKTDQDNVAINGDVSEEVNILDGKTVGKDDSDDSTETGSESESSEDILNVTNQSPVSGSINYFVAPLDSSETQAMVIEELNQLKEENEKLRRDLQEANQARDEEKKRVVSLQRKLAKIEKREADETAALENMIHMVEKNLELTTQRALRAEATVSKLKEEVNILKTESVPIATYNQLLDANQSTMTAVRDKSRAAADQMNAAAKNAEQAVRQLLSGVDTLKFISQQLDSIDRITDVHVHSDER
ncbi:hypothetical protein ACROYT_G013778 [Oculina patagonica]